MPTLLDMATTKMSQMERASVCWQAFAHWFLKLLSNSTQARTSRQLLRKPKPRTWAFLVWENGRASRARDLTALTLVCPAIRNNYWGPQLRPEYLQFWCYRMAGRSRSAGRRRLVQQVL